MSQKLNIQEIKDSGILEQFALGLTDVKQNEEIKSWIENSQELQQELKSIQNCLELFASQYAVPLPKELKSKIIQRIEMESNQMELKKTQRITLYRLAVALTVPFIIVAAYLWMQQQSTRSEFYLLKQQFEEVNALRVQDSLVLLDCNTRLEVLRNKDAIKILLKGTPLSPQSFAAVYFDSSSQKIYLDVLDLPTAPVKKQYQLWAIVSGQPVDLGVFDLGKNNSSFKAIKFVNKPQAFAITLEQEGGVPSPTMDQMYVVGGI